MSPTTLLADEYFSALQRASRSEAVDVVVRARAWGAGVWDLAHHVIGRAQHEVGLRWQHNDWTVADEHAATVISSIALSAVAGGVVGVDRPRGTVVAACVEGEWHSFPLRLLAEGLREAGWAVIDLGASLPADQLAGFLVEHRPDAVVLSASLPGRLPAAAAAVAASTAVGVPALLGGGAVAGHPEWVARLGATGGSGDPSLLQEQMLDLRGVLPATPEPPQAAFEEVAAAEYQLTSRVRSEVARSAQHVRRDEWELLLDRFLPELVAALAASLLVDEASLLGDQVSWLEGAVSSRGGPTGAVGLVLDALQQALEQLAPHAAPALADVR